MKGIVFYLFNCMLVLVLVAVCGIQNLHAQGRQVEGVVLDSLGQVPVADVTVSVRGTNAVTITNTDGRYRIDVSDLSAVLSFRHLAYQSQEVPIAGRNRVDVVLVPNPGGLEEVVVVGFGTQKRKTLTGSVADITGAQLNTTTTADVTNMMAGKLPGVRITQKTGAPGTFQTKIDIRGLGSPLILVDGTPTERWQEIDPEQIANISVLKDGAAAVYGVRSANGVVLITTKQGQSGRSDISYSGVYGIQEMTRVNKGFDLYRNAVMFNEMAHNSGAAYNATVNNGRTNATNRFSDEQLQAIKDGLVPQYDWYDETIKPSAPLTRHNFTASGGSSNIRYFSSIGYIQEEGMWRSGDLNYHNYNFRTRVNADLTKDLEAEVNVYGKWGLKRQPIVNEAVLINVSLNPDPAIPPFINGDRNYPSDGVSLHPVVTTDRDMSGGSDFNNRNFSGNFTLSYKVPFIKGLKAQGFYSLNHMYDRNRTWQKAFDVYRYNEAENTYTSNRVNHPSTLAESFAETTRKNLRFTLDYSTVLDDDHSVNATLVYDQLGYNLHGFRGFKRFVLNAVDELYAGLHDGAQTVTNLPIAEDANVSFIGRFNYSYKTKYMLEGTVNYNGSSKFAPNRRWGLFPSVSAGWRISDEDFMKDNVSFINDLKLRASWGRMGDDAASTYQWLVGYTYPVGNYIFSDASGNPSAIPALGFQNQPNPAISWFTSTMVNLGFDAFFLNNKLGLTFDLFSRERSGLLATRAGSIPGTLGTNLPQENLNSDRARGVELALIHNNKVGDFSYSISGNVSYTRTRYLYVDRAPSTNSYDNWRNNLNNRYNNIIWGYQFEDYFRSFDDIFHSPIQDGVGNQIFLPGDLKFQDWNEDGIIDENDMTPIMQGMPIRFNLQMPADNHMPELNYGIVFDANWKNFDINMLFAGASRFSIRYEGLHLESANIYGNGYEFFWDRWHRVDLNDPNSEWIAGKYPPQRAYASNAAWNSNQRNSTFWYHDASFFRLKSLEIGYTIPRKFTKERLGLQSIRIYSNGFNLFTISDVRAVDPELSPAQFGLEYPIVRSYNFGLKLTF